MNSSVHARIRHTGLVLATATALAFVVASSALAGTRPAASFYTPQQLQAMSERWAAEDRYTPEQLKAMRKTWDANASLLARKYASAASFYTPQQLQAMSERWAAEDRYTPQQLQAMRAKWDANARLLASQYAGASSQVNRSGFDWGDFGIGAGAGIGLLLLMSGLAAGAYYGRRTHHHSGSTA